jgi:hypothetical protein
MLLVVQGIHGPTLGIFGRNDPVDDYAAANKGGSAGAEFLLHVQNIGPTGSRIKPTLTTVPATLLHPCCTDLPLLSVTPCNSMQLDCNKLQQEIARSHKAKAC